MLDFFFNIEEFMNMVIVFLMSVLVLAYPPLQVNVRLLLFSLRYVYATLSSYFDGRYWLNVPLPLYALAFLNVMELACIIQITQGMSIC